MTLMAPGRLPPRGALLLVSLSRTESADWSADPETREDLVEGFRKMAKAKGRRFLEIRDHLGGELCVSEVVQ